MYNLKKEFRGTFKGLIGECMFKLIRKKLILTQYFNKNKFLKIFKLSNKEKVFLEKNWYSIDGIEFDYSKKPRKITLYEIKTLNKSFKIKPLWNIPTMTLNTHNLYNEALNLGFDVKLAIVKLYDNWDYEVMIEDFKKKNYCISKSRKYDKK